MSACVPSSSSRNRRRPTGASSTRSRSSGSPPRTRRSGSRPWPRSCRPRWELRLRDLNVAPLDEADLAWADAVLVSGMLVQAPSVREVLRRARALGRRTVVGGPAASSAPELFDEADHLFRGEAEGRLDLLVRVLEAPTPDSPRLLSPEGDDRPELRLARVPRFELIELSRYGSHALQYSRGCPFKCEFCDIIEIFGRVPRVKSPEQIVAELDALHALGARGTLFFVDDNFVGNRGAVARLLPVLRAWQERNGFPFVFCTEASIDLATHPGLVTRDGRRRIRAGLRRARDPLQRRPRRGGEDPEPAHAAGARGRGADPRRARGVRGVHRRLRQRRPGHLRPAARVHLGPPHRAGDGEPADGAPRDAAVAAARAGGAPARLPSGDSFATSQLRARRWTSGRLLAGYRRLLAALYAPDAYLRRCALHLEQARLRAQRRRAQRRQRLPRGARSRGVAPRAPRPSPAALLAAHRERPAARPRRAPARRDVRDRRREPHPLHGGGRAAPHRRHAGGARRAATPAPPLRSTGPLRPSGRRRGPSPGRARSLEAGPPRQRRSPPRSPAGSRPARRARSWVPPSSTSAIARGSTATPSSRAAPTPRQRRSGFVTAISYRVRPKRQVIAYPGQEAGMHGSSSKVAPWRRSPRMLSSPARYIQPAEPVYQVHPARPACSGCAVTSPARTYGSPS